MASRDDVLRTARTYLGTRFQHQGRQPGIGMDCVGILACVAKELDLSKYDFTSYGLLPHDDALVFHLHKAGLSPIDPKLALPADVLLMRFAQEPHHVALLTDKGILHAHLGARRVVEHRLDEIWSKRIVGAYRFPHIDTE